MQNPKYHLHSSFCALCALLMPSLAFAGNADNLSTSFLNGYIMLAMIVGCIMAASNLVFMICALVRFYHNKTLKHRVWFIFFGATLCAGLLMLLILYKTPFFPADVLNFAEFSFSCIVTYAFLLFCLFILYFIAKQIINSRKKSI